MKKLLLAIFFVSLASTSAYGQENNILGFNAGETSCEPWISEAESLRARVTASETDEDNKMKELTRSLIRWQEENTAIAEEKAAKKMESLRTETRAWKFIGVSGLALGLASIGYLLILNRRGLKSLLTIISASGKQTRDNSRNGSSIIRRIVESRKPIR